MSTTVFSAEHNNNTIFHNDDRKISSSYDTNLMQYSAFQNNMDSSSSMKHIAIPIFFQSPTDVTNTITSITTRSNETNPIITCSGDESVSSSSSSTIDHSHVYYLNGTTLSLINSMETNTTTTNELTFIIMTTTMTPSTSCRYDHDSLELPDENILPITESISAFTRLLLIIWSSRNIEKVSILNHIITNDDDPYIESQAYIVSRLLDSICMSTTIHDVGLYRIIYHTLSLVRLLRFTRSLKSLRLDSCSIVEQLNQLKERRQQQQQPFPMTSRIVRNNDDSNNTDKNNVDMSIISSVIKPFIHNGQNNSNLINDSNMNSSTSCCCHITTTEEHQLNSVDHNTNVHQHQEQQNQRHSQVGTSIDSENSSQQQQSATSTTAITLPIDLCFAFMDSRIEILEIHEKYELNIAHILRNIAGAPISHIRHVKLYPLTSNNDANNSKDAVVQRSFDYVKDAIHTLIEESNTIQQIDLIGFNYVNKNADYFHYDDDVIRTSNNDAFQYCMITNDFPIDKNIIDQFLIPKSIQINFDLCHFTAEQYHLLCNLQNKSLSTASTTMNRRHNTFMMMEVDNINEIALENHDNDAAIEANLRQQQQRRMVPAITISCANLLWKDRFWYQPTTMMNGTDTNSYGNHFILDNEGKCQALSRILHKLKLYNRQITLELITNRLPKNKLSFKDKNGSSTKQKLLHSLKRNSTICQVTLIDHGTSITNGINYLSYFDYRHDFKLIQYVCDRNEKLFHLLISTIVGSRYYHHDNSKAKNDIDNGHHPSTNTIIGTIYNSNNKKTLSPPFPISIVPKLLQLVLDCDDGPYICYTILQAL